MRIRSIQVLMFLALAFSMAETAAAQHVYNVTVLGTANSGLSSAAKIKSLVEKDFLRADPRYAECMHRVRTRWIPFLL